MSNRQRITQLIIALVLAVGMLGPGVMRAEAAKEEPKAPPDLLQLAKGSDEAPRAHPAVLQMAQEHPNEKLKVIVQRKALENLPDQALERMGGKKTKDLPLINGFALELPGKAVEALAKSSGVRWVSLDAPLISTGNLNSNVRDEFTTVSYNGNNGTVNWSNDWQEIGEANGPSGGYVQVTNSDKCAAGNCLRLNKYGVSRQVSLNGASSATLGFSYRRYRDADASGKLNLQVSVDGGTSWTTLASYPFDHSDSAPIGQSFDLTPYLAANTQIRFQASSYIKGGYFYVDNVQIEYSYPVSESLQDIGVDRLQSELALDGQGISVAVVDSGIADHADLRGPDKASRILAASNQTNAADTSDGYGHGSHIAGILASNGNASNGKYKGVAPGVSLINVKVSDDEGYGTVSDLVEGLQWIYENKAAYNIRVVNISVNSSVPEPYYTSALDAAVEILWFNGIVVVVSAGNNGTGSEPVTLLPPANDPFVISVGSADDLGTADLNDDLVSAFSAYGLTEDNYAKPDLVAPGRNVISLSAGPASWVNKNHPKHKVDDNYFRMSGTSMAAPMVTGAVALLLQDEPDLTPDQVKYRLMATANASWPAYDPAKAGAGYLDAYAAVQGTTTESANIGITASQTLWTGSDPAAWDSVAWNSVAWNSVAWNSVAWNSVAWNSSLWDD